MSDDLERGLPEDPAANAQKVALDTLARSSESPEAYIRERQDMQAADEGEQPDPNERVERIYDALEKTKAADAEAREQAGFDRLQELNDEYQRQYENISAEQAEWERLQLSKASNEYHSRQRCCTQNLSWS
jgi:hypothetical protein